MHASLPFLLHVRYWVQPMIYIREYPSQARLKELFDYVNGNLVWKERPRSDFNSPQGYGSFNKLRAGKIALTGKIHGYWVVKINGSAHLLHRLIWIWNNGDLRTDQEVDHEDGNPLNCALGNLRIADRSRNLRNTKLSKRNTSGHKGISWDKRRSQWNARIKKDGKQITKDFKNKEDAIEFIRKLREELHGEFHNHGD